MSWRFLLGLDQSCTMLWVKWSFSQYYFCLSMPIEMSFHFFVSLSCSYEYILNFVKGLFCVYWDDHVNFSFSTFIWIITFIGLCGWTFPAFPGWGQLDCSIWSFQYKPVFCLQVFYWRNLNVCIWGILSYSVFFVVVSFHGFAVRAILASWKEFVSAPFISIFEIFHKLVVDLYISGRILLWIHLSWDLIESEGFFKTLSISLFV